MANRLLFAGDVFVDILTPDGKSTGLLGPVNCTQLEITHPEPEVIEAKSTKRLTFGQLEDAVTLPNPVEVSAAFDEMPTEILQLAMQGTPSVLTQAAVTDEAWSVVARLGKWVELGWRSVTDLTVANPAALVEGTDYQVDYAAGLFLAIDGGGITDGSTVDGTLSADALTSDRISGATVTQISIAIKMHGTNQVDGKTGMLEIAQAIVSPTEPIDFFSGEFVAVTLGGKLKTPAGAGSPYTFDIDRPAP